MSTHWRSTTVARLASVPGVWLRGAWRLAGSRQCVHGCAGLGLACLVLIAWELGGVNHALGTIAQAQAISAYAVLRQLQAPGQVRLAAAASAGSAAPSRSAPIAAIDPLLLGSVPGGVPAAAAPATTPSAARGP